jgi:serine/threonine-protein kinase
MPACSWQALGAGAAVGTTLAGRYALDTVLGEGEYGPVFEATDLTGTFTAPVAVRIMQALDRRAPAFREFAARAFGGAPALSADVGDLGWGEDPAARCMFTVMRQLARHRTLARALADDGRWAPARAGAITGAICAALAQLPIHGGLRPTSVFLVEDDPARPRVVVCDFGLDEVVDDPRDARSRPWPLPERLARCAPEVVCGQPRTPRTDVHAVGLCLFEMLAGRPAIEPHEHATATLTAIVGGPAPALAPDVPAPLAAVVARALARDPDARFASPQELRAAIAAALAAIS